MFICLFACHLRRPPSKSNRTFSISMSSFVPVAPAVPEDQDLRDQILKYLDSASKERFGDSRKKSILRMANDLVLPTVSPSQKRYILLLLTHAFPIGDGSNHRTLSRNLLLALASAIGAPFQELENCARHYFTNQYEALESSITFEDKPQGVQTGTIIMFRRADSLREHRFYVKTHLLGSRFDAEQSFMLRPVDPYEIFVYKFLELTGFGPDVHFFWKSANEFYIATRDVSTCGATENSTPLPCYFYGQIRQDPGIATEVTFDAITNGLTQG
jgi:hypothetical protein